MGMRWSRRRSHPRHLTGGRVTFVKACWISIPDAVEPKKNSYRHNCPVCGASIISVHMPKGGWVHFEGAKELVKVKHPCLHQGEGLSKRKDEDTPDLFDEGDLL